MKIEKKYYFYAGHRNKTSAENMAIWLFTRIKNETKLPIIRIELAETKSSTIIYEPEVSN